MATNLVIHLDPASLLAHGAWCSDPVHAVVGVHRWVIIARPTRSVVVPLFSEDGPGRILVNRKLKRGPPAWTGKMLGWPPDAVTTYFHPRQHWTADNTVIKEIAEKVDTNLDGVPELILNTESMIGGQLLPPITPYPRRRR